MQNGKGVRWWWWSKIKEWGHRKGLSVVDSRLTLKHRVLEMSGGITGFGSVNLHLLIIQADVGVHFFFVFYTFR